MIREGKPITRCPKCGGRIIVSYLMQYSLDFKVLLNGKLSKKSNKVDGGGIDCAVASCEDMCGMTWESDEFDIIDDVFVSYVTWMDEEAQPDA